MWGWIKALFSSGDVVKTAAQVIDKATYTQQEKSEDDSKDTADARSFAAPLNIPGNIFDSLVDGFNRLIRPGVTTWLIGGFCHWWELPKPKDIDPYWMQVFLIVLTFWFGGRALLKDLPNAVAAILNVVRRNR